MQIFRSFPISAVRARLPPGLNRAGSGEPVLQRGPLGKEGEKGKRNCPETSLKKIEIGIKQVQYGSEPVNLTQHRANGSHVRPVFEKAADRRCPTRSPVGSSKREIGFNLMPTEKPSALTNVRRLERRVNGSNPVWDLRTL